MSFSGWKRWERIWTSVYLQNLVNTTTASVFPLEIVPVEILIQILFLLQMIILQCKHSNTILIYASFPCHAIQHITFFSAFYIPLPWSNFSRTQQLHTQNTSTLLTESNSLSHPRGLMLLIQLERLPQSAGTRAVMHQTSQHCSLPYSHLPLSSSSAATFQQHSNRHICWSLLNCTEYLLLHPTFSLVVHWSASQLHQCFWKPLWC